MNLNIINFNNNVFKKMSYLKNIFFIIVRTQFVTIPNWYWVRTLKAQTIKFIERGLKGLALVTGQWLVVAFMVVAQR